MKESQSVEFKEGWRDEYLKWLCGFANAGGGVLIIGKNDKGEAIGVAQAAKLLEDLPNKIRDVLGIIADVRLVEEGGKELLEIHIGPYPAPISYKGEFHYRSGSTKQVLKGAALETFLLRKQGHHWDSHASKPHNPLIAGAFFRTGDIESWGRGIEKVRAACSENHTDFPTFRFEPTGLMVFFKGRVPSGSSKPETSVKTSVKTPVKILALLQENPEMTLMEVAENIGRSLRAVERAASKLVKDGQLRYVGPRKGGKWEVLESEERRWCGAGARD